MPRPSRQLGAHGKGKPLRLTQGQSFHAELQADFIETSEGKVTAERCVRTADGKRGRIDIHVEVDESLHSVVEFKRSNWDQMELHRVRPNIRRYIRQVWRYVEAIMEEGHDVSPGIVFAKEPRNSQLRRQIEEAFEEACITIVWADAQAPHSRANGPER